MLSHLPERPSIIRNILSFSFGFNALPASRSLHQSPRRLATEVTSVAVLGGGITGLAATYYLSKWLPQSTHIELFESSSRLGGWIGSTKVDVGKGEVVFENGPRSLRPAGVSGLVTLDLIAELGLADRIISTLKDSPAARSRYIYYPDHLVRLPGPGGGILGNLRTFFTEPIFDGIRAGILSEVNKPKRSSAVQDESVGDFISRRFGHELADNVVSAVFHGIYAGDIYKLSARSIVPALWHTEERYSSLMRGVWEQSFGREHLSSIADVENEKDTLRPLTRGQQLKKGLGNVSLYTLQDGLGELVNGLLREIGKAPNVVVSIDTRVQAVTKYPHEAALQIQSKGNSNKNGSEPRHFSHMISTVQSSVLANCLEASSLTEKLSETSTVSVMVVNLFYDNADILPVHGFGYLLPRSVPLDQNPEAALGVIFDTDALPKQDGVIGTKVTVILGGHWWDGWDAFPSEQDGLHKAKSILKRHLKIEEEPRAVRVTLQRNCIPQYNVGHDGLMSGASQDLVQLYDTRLRVAGSSYTGVGVNDCIRSARDVVKGLVDGTAKTGLDTFAAGRPWTWKMPMSKTGS